MIIMITTDHHASINIANGITYLLLLFSTPLNYSHTDYLARAEQNRLHPRIGDSCTMHVYTLLVAGPSSTLNASTVRMQHL